MGTLKVGDNVYFPLYNVHGQLVRYSEEKEYWIIRIFKGSKNRIEGWTGMYGNEAPFKEGNVFLYAPEHLIYKLKGVKWQKKLKRNKLLDQQ